MKRFKEYVGVGPSAGHIHPVADLGDIPDYRRLYAQANKKKTKKKVETFSKFKDKE